MFNIAVVPVDVVIRVNDIFTGGPQTRKTKSFYFKIEKESDKRLKYLIYLLIYL